MNKTTASSRLKPPRPQKSPPVPEKSTPASPIELSLQQSPLSNSYGPSPISSPLKSVVNDRDGPTAAEPVQRNDGWMSDLQNEPIHVTVPLGTEPNHPNLQIPLTSIQKEEITDPPRKSEPDELCITPEMERICVQSLS